MTGALAGAFYGAEAIPAKYIAACEASDEARSLADRLFARRRDM